MITKSLKIIWLTICVSSTSLRAAPVGADLVSNAWSWLAYGDLRGYLEPCGCDPATDMGGVKRIYGLLQRERLAHPSLLLFDLGNDLPVKDTEAVLKTPFLLDAVASIKPAAILFNELELRHVAHIERALRAEQRLMSQLPYVVSNMAPSAHLPARPFVETKEALILGYLSPHIDGKPHPSLRPLNDELLKAWKSQVQSHAVKKQKPAVLLFAGSQSDLQIILESRIFNEVVSSNANTFEVSPGPQERYDEAKLLRQAPATYMVPLGGQGVLRGGALRRDEAKSLSELLVKKSESLDQPKESIALLNKTILVSWLEPKGVSEDGLAALFVRYNAAAKSSFNAGVAARAKDLADSSYVGAVACSTCHVEAYAKWQGTKHAHAMRTLQEKNKDQDAECVACHVVGAKAKGGFASMTASPQLANVQCENCHGPRRDHAQKPLTLSKAQKSSARDEAQKICGSCHNTTHSPSFNYQTFWPQIKHGAQ